jgi:peptidoglycan/LPS O-acetylase OafA/YrhL
VSTGSASSSYRHDIDGLRAIAVLAVIANHINKGLAQNGFLGVDVFFLISGYVITSSLSRRPATTWSGWLASFYARRMKRLLPALLVCIAVTVLLGSLVIPPYAPAGGSSWRTGMSAIFGLSNVYLHSTATDYFAESSDYNLFTQTWSLGVEEQFYFFFPLLLWLTGFAKGRVHGRADSKCQIGFSSGCRIAIARSAVMSCITACRPSRIESNPARRSRFRAAVRIAARTAAPFPR